MEAFLKVGPMIPRIENYTDYRKFLKDYYALRKKQSRHYTYRNFCDAAGLKSPSLYIEVVKGKRNLTNGTLEAFIRGLKLNKQQARFFTALVNYNQSKDAKAQQTYLEMMRGCKPSIEQAMVMSDQYEYYSKWYHSAIREIACTLDWHEDFSLLAKALEPAIRKTEARASIQLLLKLGFIKKTPDGRYHQVDANITSGSEVRSVAVRKLNEDLAGMGKDAIEKYDPKERDISSMIAGVSAKSYPQIKREIQEFKQRVMQIVDEDTVTERVYNINIQLFPLSKQYVGIEKEGIKNEKPDENPIY